MAVMQFAFRPSALLRVFRPQPAPIAPSPGVPEARLTPSASAPLAPRDLGHLIGDDADDTLENWLDDCTLGPRFGPRLVALAAIGDDPDALAADAMARLAQRARAADRDVLIVDACGLSDHLADALDTRLGKRARGADPFGATARVEMLALSEVIPDGTPPRAGALRKTFDLLAANADLVFIALPDVADWAAVPSLLSAADDIVLLRRETDSDRASADATDAAGRRGIEIAGAITICD